MRTWIILFFHLFPLLLPAQEKQVTYIADPHQFPPDKTVKLHHVQAHLSFKPSDGMVVGEASLKMTPLQDDTDSLVFYTPGFAVGWVRIEGNPVPFIRRGDQLVVYPGRTMSHAVEALLEMQYTSHPDATGIYFIGWKPEETGKRKQIWAHRPFGWLPYMEGRVTMDLTIAFDSSFSVFANGIREQVIHNEDGSTTWHYLLEQNHPFFSTALAIGDYAFEQRWVSDSIPLELLYYRGQQEKVGPTYQFTEEMFSLFELEMGMPYPYAVYREIPVMDYMYGGMECTTATIFGDYMLIDPRAYWQRNYINVNAHELAHQWFGDGISHLANGDVWLTESFGTYYAKVFERSAFGEEYYQHMVRMEQEAALEASKRNRYPVASSQGGRERIYDKGSLVLGMLREVMGERAFRDVIRSYLRQFIYSEAATPDFFRVVYDVTGRSLHWFFDEWILRPGEPHYRVSYEESDNLSGQRSTRITIEQIHPVDGITGLFTMPVQCQVWYTDGSHDSLTVWISQQKEEVRITNPEKKSISFVLFDSGNHILKQITFPKTKEALHAQAIHAPVMIDRYDAIVAMRTLPMDKKRDILMACFENESFFYPKAEIIHQLAGDTAPETIYLLGQAIRDPDARVRQAFLDYVNPIPDALKKPAETLLSDYSYLNVASAISALCRDFPEDASKYLELTRHEVGWRGFNIRINWLKQAVISGESDHLNELVRFAYLDQDFETRINAFQALLELGFVNDTTWKLAKDASGHWNRKLAVAAQTYCHYFGKQGKYRN